MNTLAVVTTVYNRPERLPVTLAMLDAQTFDPFVVYLVNNNPTLRDYVDAEVEKWQSLDVRVQHNGRNMGSQAENQKGHECAVEGFPFVVYVDDDVDFNQYFLARMWVARDKNAIVSRRAYRFVGDYWQREEVDYWQPAHYVQGNCCVVPRTVLIDPRVTRLNERYWPADDLWLSFVANHHHGMTLTSAPIEGVSINVDGKDQYTRHVDMKREFLDELRAEGWNA
jgi:glycosyltransferase involved in cell wall biosynthesis